MICSPLGLSDHSVLVFDLLCYAECDAAESKRFMYNKGDFHGMREFLSSLIWEEEFADLNNDVNQQWSHLVHIISRGAGPRTRIVLINEDILVNEDNFVCSKIRIVCIF